MDLPNVYSHKVLDYEALTHAFSLLMLALVLTPPDQAKDEFDLVEFGDLCIS